MASFRASVEGGAGALLALLGCCFTSAAVAAPDEENARSAAPVACTAEQFALRAYVIALESGDVTSGARDPARLVEAITPSCRQAIANGRWPGLTNELLAHAAGDGAVKRVLCAIAPPEALSAIAEWERADDETRGAYDVPCAVALFRYRPEDFARVVVPRLSGGGGCEFSLLPMFLGEALRPDERIGLLPTLDFATGTRARGRDHLYEVLCQHPAARTKAACQTPAVLEPTWAHEARIRRATPWIAFHVGLAVLFALGVCLLRYYRGKGWPGPASSGLATAATAAAVTWIVASADTPGAGALNGMNIVLAVVASPVAALIGGALAWILVRAAPSLALLWCLLHAVVYAAVTAVHVWRNAWDRLC
ncbi:MAG TPA: hypothetical protein VIU64_17755 [Polyangia bacterium]